jgi:hypothetical protein
MGHKLGEELKGLKFAKFLKYFERALDRPSLKQAHNKVCIPPHEQLMTYSLLPLGVCDHFLQDEIR